VLDAVVVARKGFYTTSQSGQQEGLQTLRVEDASLLEAMAATVGFRSNDRVASGEIDVVREDRHGLQQRSRARGFWQGAR